MTHRMLATFPVLLAVVTACSTTTTTQPQAPAVASVVRNDPGDVEQTSVATMSAVVERVDVEEREVTLRTADGRTTTLSVGPEVRNLAQVEKGDEVRVGYLESVAIHVKKPGEGTVGAVAEEDVARAAPGEKPGGAAAVTLTITAEIVDIDREAQEVTLEGEDGERVTLDVRNPRHFDVIAVGDLVEITYTEALAISVEPVADE